MADLLQWCASCGKSQDELGEALLRCGRCKSTTYCSMSCQAAAWSAHKKTCTPSIPSFSGPPSSPASGRRTIHLLELEDYSWLGDRYDEFHAQIKASSDYSKSVKVGTAIDSVASNPNAVVLFEPSVRNMKKQVKHQVLNETLVAYVKAGGTVVFGCQCSNHVSPNNLEWYFDAIWGLPWKFGNYARFEFEPNPNVNRINEKAVPSRYNAKAVKLNNVDENAVVYWQAGESYSMAGLPTPSSQGNKSGPVVWQKYGEGYVVWLGDVNNEVETGELTRIMCGI